MGSRSPARWPGSACPRAHLRRGRAALARALAGVAAGRSSPARPPATRGGGARPCPRRGRGRGWSPRWQPLSPSLLCARPWFIYTFLGLGIFLCLLTCSGHIAAETANGQCLSCYMIIVFVLIVLEGAITIDVFLNTNWEEDFPPDPSGKFEDFKDFVRSNFEICEWAGLSVVAAQVLSIILGMVLRTLGPDRETDYDSDDDAIVHARLPLLRNQSQHGLDYAEPNTSRRSDSWKLRILDKVNN